MSEAYAVESAETGSTSSDSGSGASAEPGEGQPPGAANDNTVQATNDNAASGSRDLAASPTLVAGEGDPAKPADLGADASQVTAAGNRGEGRPIGEMKSKELSQEFGKEPGKKGGGAGGGGKDGGGNGEDGDKEKGTGEQPVSVNEPTRLDVPVGADGSPNATETSKAGTDKAEATDGSGSATQTSEAEADETEATDGSGSSEPSPKMQQALNQYEQSKAVPATAASRSSFIPGQEASAGRTKAQSKPNGPRGPG
jgi:hypothetical protein